MPWAASRWEMLPRGILSVHGLARRRSSSLADPRSPLRLGRGSWSRWVEEQLEAGAGALHAFNKKEDVPTEAPVLAKGIQQQSLQARVNAELDFWKELWLKFEGIASAPWEGIGSDLQNKFKWFAELPEITAEELAVFARTFKLRTGIWG